MLVKCYVSWSFATIFYMKVMDLISPGNRWCWKWVPLRKVHQQRHCLHSRRGRRIAMQKGFVSWAAEMWRFPWIIQVAQNVIISVLIRGKGECQSQRRYDEGSRGQGERCEGATLLALKTEEGVMSQTQATYKHWERPGRRFSPRASRRSQPWQHLMLRHLTSRAVREMYLCCFKPLSLGQLLQEQQEADT